jgi:hypothetical protein
MGSSIIDGLRYFIAVAALSCWMGGLSGAQTTAPATAPATAASVQTHASVTIDWSKVIGVSQSTATLQVLVNPLLEKGSPIHEATFAALRSLGAEDVRYVP